MANKTFYKSRLRPKGQITVPTEIRSMLGAEEGDDLFFSADENGRVIISRALIIPPDQAWFWSERWQRMEKEAQADIEAGRIYEFEDLDRALTDLDRTNDENNAED